MNRNTLCLLLIFVSNVVFGEQIYKNNNIAIYATFPKIAFEIFNPQADIFRSAFIKKPLRFVSSDNTFEIDCGGSSCKINLVVDSRENFDSRVPFVYKALSKQICSKLAKKIKFATYKFDNENLELNFLANGKCCLTYLDSDNYSCGEIDAAVNELVNYKQNKRKEAEHYSLSITDHDWLKNRAQAIFSVDRRSIAWVKNKLRSMFEIDQKARWILIDYQHKQNHFSLIDKIYFERTLLKALMAIDVEHNAEIKELLNRYYWFTFSKFGAEADNDGWLLIQHQDHDLELQKAALKRLEKLYSSGEVFKPHFALLYDRIAIAENRPQKFGTQGKCVAKGKWEPAPLVDASMVDKFREDMELEPMSEYKKRFKDICP